MKTLAVMFCAFCAVAGVAQERSSVSPNTINVSAQGTANVEPDTAVVRFNLSAQEKSAKAAYDRASKGVEQVREMTTLRKYSLRVLKQRARDNKRSKHRLRNSRLETFSSPRRFTPSLH